MMNHNIKPMSHNIKPINHNIEPAIDEPASTAINSAIEKFVKSKKSDYAKPVIAVPGKGTKPVIAVPGKGTTAFVLFSLFMKEQFPEVEYDIIYMPFEKIMPAVKNGSVDFGVVIHEGRFIYQNLGLECLLDLGAWWESKNSLPIPLGCIAIKRDICRNNPDAAYIIQKLIGQSIQYAFDYPKSSHDYIREHAQELDDQVIARHIELYVNDFSKDIGTEGEVAIRTFFQKAEDACIIKPNSQPLFAC
ncbi:MAG: 1,4-dihydroxy-6-naphthoate synthase [Desulfamplus sp.]|nr:1,4-dihydroxy-6-naphthoate synthase [Desulfamplus sp.]